MPPPYSIKGQGHSWKSATLAYKLEVVRKFCTPQKKKIPLKLLSHLKFSSEILTENQCGIIWSPRQKTGLLQAAAS